MINGYDDAGGGPALYYDAPEYRDFWRTAAALRVPIYLHPRTVPPDRSRRTARTGALRRSVGLPTSRPERVLRLMLGGVFDDVPNLQLVIGHMGEMIVVGLAHRSPRLSRGGPDGADGARRASCTTSAPTFT